MNNADNKLTPEQMKILKDFRAFTGHSLGDCKSTLIATNFDTKLANEILKKKYADKYAILANSDDVEAPEFVTKVFCDLENGICGYATVRSKSDVVTRSEQMRDFLIKTFDILNHHDDEAAGLNYLNQNENFKAEYDNILSYFREPIKFEKIRKRKLTKGEVMASYSHTVYHKANDNNKSYTISKSAAPIVLKYEGDLNEDDIEKIRKLARGISMTIIGSNKAKVFSPEELDPKMIEDFKNKKIEEAKTSGKPEAAIEKIVAGQLNKFYKENLIIYLPIISTTDLPWLKCNSDITVEEAIKQTEDFINQKNKTTNCKISVSFYKVLTEK